MSDSIDMQLIYFINKVLRALGHIKLQNGGFGSTKTGNHSVAGSFAYISHITPMP